MWVVGVIGLAARAIGPDLGGTLPPATAWHVLAIIASPV
jgi:hypothetical protein